MKCWLLRLRIEVQLVIFLELTFEWVIDPNMGIGSVGLKLIICLDLAPGADSEPFEGSTLRVRTLVGSAA
jgi:hypothetical protein